MGEVGIFILNFNNGNELINNSPLPHIILIYKFTMYEYF